MDVWMNVMTEQLSKYRMEKDVKENQSSKIFPNDDTHFLQRISDAFWALSSKLPWSVVMSQTPLMSPLNSGAYACGHIGSTTVPAPQFHAPVLHNLLKGTRKGEWFSVSCSQQSRAEQIEGRWDVVTASSETCMVLLMSSEEIWGEKSIIFAGQFYPTLEDGCPTKSFPCDVCQLSLSHV